MDIASLEERISKIEIRNSKVEKEKQWETSWTRKLSIALITYCLLAAYLGIVLKVDPFMNAIVPTVGFLLSTMSLSIIKNVWVKRNSKNS